ncbi:MAG: hydrolase, partial [Chloroflexota bacterium]
RKRACDRFGLDYEEMNERHHLTFDTYEAGKLSLDEYLTRVVFYEPRSYTRDDFIRFMFDQSQPYPDMIALMKQIKAQHRVKLAVLSNEGRELMTYRIQKFGLSEFVDFFIASSFVHFRKPDHDIFRIALDMAQTPIENILYLEDRQMFVEVASSLGLRSLRHTDYAFTRQALADVGLAVSA